MTLDEFWEHIAKSNREEPDAHAERIEERLVKLKPDEVLDFIHWWETMSREAYGWNLWGAAYLINGGCSDDGFHYFCNWLILKGRDVFQAALTNPDTFADVVEPDDGELEWDGPPGRDAWFAVTKTKDNEAGNAAVEAAELARFGEHPMVPDLGNMWDRDDDEKMRKHVPRLLALYYGGDGGE